jgi:hypothetical protein
MFFLCVRIIAMAIKTENILKYIECVLNSVNSNIGKAIPMVIDATDTYPVIRSTTRKIEMQDNVRNG